MMISRKMYLLGAMLIFSSIANATSAERQEASKEKESMALSQAESFKEKIQRLASRLEANEIDVPTFITEFDQFYTEYTNYKLKHGSDLGVNSYLNEHIEPIFRKLLTKYTNFSLN